MTIDNAMNRTSASERLTPLLQKGKWSPTVRVLETPEGLVVEKRYEPQANPLRDAIFRLLIRRERDTLRYLAGLPGIPQLLPGTHPYRLRTAYIRGRTIMMFAPGDIPDDVFHRLDEVIASMHARYVVHLDLRHPKNILIREDNRPFLLDFATAIRFRLRDRLAIWFFKQLASIDRSALLKYKHRLFPDLLTNNDRTRLRRYQTLRWAWFFKPVPAQPLVCIRHDIPGKPQHKQSGS